MQRELQAVPLPKTAGTRADARVQTRKRPAEVVATIGYLRPLLSLDGRGRFFFESVPPQVRNTI